MTLQYRTRNTWDDQQWNQRVRLSDSLLMDVVDWWCRGEREFPVDSTVASFLFLYSPRCKPFAIHEAGLRRKLFDTVDSPSAECALTWPTHDKRQQLALIESLRTILQDAVGKWNEGLLSELPVAVVNQRLADEIVDHKYVVFHHTQTTRRDGGGFYALW